ncbi:MULTISPECIES: hypothetical protein [Bacillus cereus group]|uniref:hypothetical protein n=1 Tax=Bacillus cereus group TaxID=86661 RepID=UPI000BEF7058|nr:MULTISPECIES: hypothetical protein [Bacillus cereus group]PEK83566.1 hypothetical protein CN594_20000 [Bacillus toyonensis]PFR63919.1 hypothetical protein COK36_01485 [Bacillus cereus]PFY37029.1 hypothetical protein COL54_25300 [Bacillus toyonensis]PFY52037.1 hypothetical protein COL55_03145 [Bacillus toyonensis]PFY77702.1 hypothetical protein COL62_22045 [Bacillus toyonensis]
MDNINITSLVQIISSIVGIGTSIVAIIISVFSLKTTKNSIEEANRPYVVVYRDYIQVLSNIHEYVIIKNFGKSGATIDSLIFEPTYLDSMKGKEIFKNVSDTFIAPGQSIATVVSTNPFAGNRHDKIKVTIKYHTDKKEYQEVIVLNEGILEDIIFTKSKPSDGRSIEEIMTKATEEILRRRL